MKKKVCHSQPILYFSHWSGKGYAVFAALNKEVQISGLSIHICEQALLKSSRNGVIITDDATCKDETLLDTWEKRIRKIGMTILFGGKLCPDENRAHKIGISKRVYPSVCNGIYPFLFAKRI